MLYVTYSIFSLDVFTSALPTLTVLFEQAVTSITSNVKFKLFAIHPEFIRLSTKNESRLL